MQQKTKHIYESGFETLQAIKQAPKFNAWMYDVVKQYCTGNILEIGSGIGNISQCFILNKRKLTLSDYNEEYYNYLQEHFGKDKYIQNVIILDLIHPQFETAYFEHVNKYDCIVIMNVIEHVQQDLLAIENMKKLLTADGRIVMLVPALPYLFNSLDKSLGHYRRYNKKMIAELFLNTNMRIIEAKYFNAAAIPGWFIAGNVFKNTRLKAGSMKMYNRLVPLFRIIDMCIGNLAGISVIGVAQKV